METFLSKNKTPTIYIFLFLNTPLRSIFLMSQTEVEQWHENMRKVAQKYARAGLEQAGSNCGIYSYAFEKIKYVTILFQK